MEAWFLLAVTVLLSCAAVPDYCLAQSDENELYKLFYRALQNDSDNLNELQRKFPLEDTSTITCAVLTYNLTCENECYEENGTSSINCTTSGLGYNASGYNASFLWTSFNTKKQLPGKVLLAWLVAGTRVFGFEWEDSCKSSFDEEIVLHLDIDTFPCVKNPVKDTSTALGSLTLMVKKYAESNGKTVASAGYAKAWSEDDIERSETVVIWVQFALAGFAVIIFLTFGCQLYNFINKMVTNKDKKVEKTRTNIFWAFQFVALIWWFGFLYPAITTGSPASIVVVVAILPYTILITYFFLSFGITIFLFLYHSLFPWCDFCHQSALLFWANFFAIWNTSAFLTYLLYSLPSIALAYYIFPSRTLVRLSYFNFAAVCLLLSFAFILYLLEELLTNCCFKRNAKAQVTDHQPQDREDCQPVTEALLDHPQGKYGSFSPQQTAINMEDDSGYVSEPAEQTRCRNCFSLCKVLAALLTLGLLIFLLILIGAITYESTADPDKSLASFLTILPTILINVILWITSKKLAISPQAEKLTKALAKQLSEQLKGLQREQQSEATNVPQLEIHDDTPV